MKMRTLFAFLMAAMIALCCSCETAPERGYPELEYGIKAYLDMSIYKRMATLQHVSHGCRGM